MTTLGILNRSFVVGEKEYTVRKLNVMDMFTVGKLLARVLREGGRTLPEDFSQEQVVMMLFGGFEYIETDLLKLCSSLIGGEDFGELDPEALPKLVEVLIESEDLKAFLGSCQEVAKKAGRLMEV